MPRPRRRPAVIAFDVIETLFSLEPVRERLVSEGFAPDALEWWFAQVLRDGFALAVHGRFEPFSHVAASALRSLAARRGIVHAETWPDDVLGVMWSLPAHEDAAPAMARAASAGARVVALTNGSAEVTRALLSSSGLDRYVERVIAIEEVGQWKPRTEVYGRVTDVTGVEPSDAALVAVHAWDVAGAAGAGLRTGWASRLERVLLPWVEPDVTGNSILEVVEGLVGG